MKLVIDAGLLQLVMNALQRDADEGKVSRGEILEEIKSNVQTLQEVLDNPTLTATLPTSKATTKFSRVGIN